MHRDRPQLLPSFEGLLAPIGQLDEILPGAPFAEPVDGAEQPVQVGGFDQLVKAHGHRSSVPIQGPAGQGDSSGSSSG